MVLPSEGFVCTLEYFSWHQCLHTNNCRLMSRLWWFLIIPWKLQCILVHCAFFDIVVDLPYANALLGMVDVGIIWPQTTWLPGASLFKWKACVSFLVKILPVDTSGIWTRETGQSLLQGLQNNYIFWPETYRLWQQLSDNLHLQGYDCISDSSCSH